MFSIFRSRTTEREADREGWNACLDAVQRLVSEHQWAVDDDEPTEIFCDGCGQRLTQALAEMRR